MVRCNYATAFLTSHRSVALVYVLSLVLLGVVAAKATITTSKVTQQTMTTCSTLLPVQGRTTNSRSHGVFEPSLHNFGKTDSWRHRDLKLFAIRGGGSGSTSWWWPPSWKQKSASQIYRETLQDQASLLEKQLRQTQDELQQLRQRFQQLAANSRQSKVKNLVQSKEEQQSEKQTILQLHQRIETLTQQLIRLEAMKLDLETMLEVQHQKVKDLESKLEQSQTDQAELRRQYQQQLRDLETELLFKAKQQLDELRGLMEQRLAEAVQETRTEVLRLSQRELQVTTERLQREAEQAVQAERRKAEDAVEKEKAKMRKLVKALADRERKLGRDHEEKAVKPKTSTSTKTSSKPNTPTVRGPFKYD